MLHPNTRHRSWSSRHVALSALSFFWATAMLVLGLRLVVGAPNASPNLPLALFGLALAMAALALFAQQVANRLFPRRSRRISDTVELTTGALFVLCLALAVIAHIATW
ncbi:MAG: hypothetical protein KDA20_02605 [Phycisphaerales bacterium]|nr:hypothetical protein [Phycisphaerales bacterium]